MIQSDPVQKEEVPLTGLLAEFRTALREEITAASRSASADAVPLVNGRRIAHVGSGYQYVFSIENALNLPGDTPGDLHVPGHARMAVTVIGVDGLSITLSIPGDLGSIVPNARLVSDLSFLMRRLIERIESLADSPNPVGERVRGALPVSGEPLGMSFAESALNGEQREAIVSSLGRNTTFILGPPGTGKTRTIGTIALELFRRGRSLLLVCHTNVAVDQAVRQIGDKLSRSELAEGCVVRVGDPKDDRLEKDYPDLLLRTHVERRSAELAARRDSLQGERKAIISELAAVSRRIDICEWLAEAGVDIDNMGAQVAEVQDLEKELHELRARETLLVASAPSRESARAAALQVKQSLAELASVNDQAARTESALSGLVEERAATDELLAGARELMVRADAIEPLRARVRELPSLESQTEHVHRAHRESGDAVKEHAQLTAKVAEAEELYAQASSVGRLTRLWRRLPDPDSQRAVVAAVQAELVSAAERVHAAQRESAAAERLLSEISDLTQQLHPHAAVPELEVQQRVVAQLGDKLWALQEEVDKASHLLAAIEAEGARLRIGVEAFERKHGGTPEEVLREVEARAGEVAETQLLVYQSRRRTADRRAELEASIGAKLAALREWGLCSEPSGSAEAMLNAIRGACECAAAEVAGLDPGELRREHSRLNSRVLALDAEIQAIEDRLKRVEETVIAEAMVVATTLTRAYLRDDIQSRRFDTVILDEASIAPIPALWVAASRAELNAVVVGDPNQLPPIVISGHELARKWLRRDVFKVARVTNDMPHVIELRQQFRMHPDISAIPNALTYDSLLRDDDSCRSDGRLCEWYAGHDDAVLLVDTGPLHAWVTSVPRGGRASRLNFLSATVCVEIAEQLLRADRPPQTPGAGHRVLIVCPYRAHAKLLLLLLREQGLDAEVHAGTAHSFQGSEADVVIFDLVNDEPHWRVAMFNPRHDDSTKPLLNVAITRARRRLVIVGDFDYIAKSAKKAFIGTRLIPFLEKQEYRRVDARRIVPAGLAARAADAQAAIFGGATKPDAAGRIFREERFYPNFCADLGHARRRVVIYSPFISRNRLGMLDPHLRAAVERGVSVFVVTKTLGERRAAELSEYRMMERALADWGMVVVHKRNMHEKLVFVDDGVLWEGSMNVLSSTGDTGEIMERRASREVVAEFADAVRLTDLIAEYRSGAPVCPVCGCEIVASEGLGKPFYWRCVNEDCRYTRDVDVPAPIGGVITCANCGGPVEFGQWGGKPAWRCTVNRHHHQKIARTHLQLPRMRDLVPKRELKMLDKHFGTGTSRKPQQSQMSLPDLFRGPSQEALLLRAIEEAGDLNWAEDEVDVDDCSI
jgi:hypothetical protein